MKYWKKKQNKISLKESRKKGRKKKDLKIQSRIFMYARIWPILIYFHWTNASSITVEGNKKERKTETGDWRSEISLKESKKKGRKKKKVWKFSHEFSRTLEFGRYLYIFIEPTRLPLYTVDKSNKEKRETEARSAYAARTGNLQCPGGYVNDTTTTPLTAAIHHAGIEHVCRYGRGKLTYYHYRSALSPPLPVHVHTCVYICICLLIIPIHRMIIKGFEKLMLRKHYIYIRIIFYGNEFLLNSKIKFPNI